MDALKSFITPKTLDTILSDPLLLVGAGLVILGILLFLFSAIKFFRYRSTNDFALPDHPIDQETEAETTYHKSEPEPVVEPAPPAPVEKAPETYHQRRAVNAADETMIMAPGVADLQAQFEIAITQIKQLNKKIFEMERQIETLANRAAPPLDTNELKEPPMDAGDFTKKLLKVVEHVIVLEKEVAKLRQPSSPPIMPL